MECKDVKSRLDDYFEGSLPDDLKDQVQDHLGGCTDCENEFKLLNNFLLQAKYLQTGIKAPKEIEDGISDQLIRLSSKSGDGEKVFDKVQLKQIKKAMRQELSKEEREVYQAKVKQKKTKVRSSYGFWNVFWILFMLVIVIGGYLLYEFSKVNAPWEIKAGAGVFTINGIKTNRAELEEGDILATENNSNVRLNIPKIGYADLSGNTTIALIKAKDGENIVKLKEGDIRVKTRVFQPGFSLVTDLVTINDIGSDFRVSVEEDSRNKIELNIGFIEIYFNGDKTTLSMEHVCYVDKKNGIGIPYHIDATESFIKALYDFQLSNGDATSLNLILSEATESDALSLWHLLTITEPNDRRRVLEKLVGFYPLPEGISEDGILSMDPTMLSLYWDEIEWQL